MGTTSLDLKKIITPNDFKDVARELNVSDDYILNVFEKKLPELSYYKHGKRHKLRNNGIRAVQLTMQYNNSTLDFETWKSVCYAWLASTFKINNHSLLFENFESDENSGKINVVFIPLTPEEKISFSYFIPDKLAYNNLFLSFQNVMKKHFNLIPVKYISNNNRIQNSFTSSTENLSADEMRRLFAKIMDICGSSEQIIPMLHLALEIKCASQYYKSNGDQERIKRLKEILHDGKTFIYENKIKF